MDFKHFFLFGLIVLSLFSTTWSKLAEVTQDNFQTKLKEKKCMFLYATRDNCEKCTLLYPKIITVSQTFENDPDILFGQISDPALTEAFDVKGYPEVVYYEFGSAIPTNYRDDITAGALTKVVSKAMRGDFRSLNVRFAVQLTRSNFQEIMDSDKQYRLVMLHEDDDEDEIEAFDELAETYDNDFEVVLARINVDKEKSLNHKYFTEVYPSFYWYPKGTVDKKKRYGGELRIEQMVAFINQQTGLNRIKGGRLNPFAGLIKPLDEVIDKHGKSLYELRYIGDIQKDVKAAIAKLPKDSDMELAKYYLHLLNEVDEDRTIESLGESRSRLYREMEGAGPLKFDQILRKKNIVQKFIDIIGKHMLKELSNGDINIPKDYMDKDETPHGLEFHEEF